MKLATFILSLSAFIALIVFTLVMVGKNAGAKEAQEACQGKLLNPYDFERLNK